MLLLNLSLNLLDLYIKDWLRMKKIVSKVEVYAVISAVFLMIFLPVLWGIGFSYRLYDNLPWPGVSIFSHLGFLIAAAIFISKFKKMAAADMFYFNLVLAYVFMGTAYSLLFILFSTEEYKLDAFMQSVVYLVHFCAFMAIGFTVFELKWPKIFVLLLFLVYVLLAYFEHNMSSTIPVSLYSIYGEFTDVVPNYQLVSLSVVFLCLLLYRTNIKYKTVFVLMALFMVFLTGGRSEFLGGVISLFFFLLLSILTTLSKRMMVKRVYLYSILMIVFFALIFIYIYFYTDADLGISNNRNLQVFNLKEASSWQARENLESKNLELIFKSPFVGNFGSHFSLGQGSYIHNILSVWQQYGFFSFLMYLIIMIFPVVNLSIVFIKKESVGLAGPLVLSFYCLLLMAVSKSVFWPYAGLSVGSYLYVRYTRV